ncbi:MAG: hypothetical protein HF314_18155 [Ignavibacteria bacterium]|jgi:mannose-6-phosphate isomerase-like protein (cupin superfamily)|nr:hypothetical protein [Ignavibacteria bacterium]MCU7505013.1 hypothetical protein [Ignavibacteria bacterium]MCU7514853.1 hypothetical protein [Ignavibacteria bacterium]
MPVLDPWPSRAPSWSEVEYYEILEVPPNIILSLQKRSEKEKLFAGKGSCSVMIGNEKKDLTNGSSVEVTSMLFHVSASEEPVTLIRIGGSWESDCGGCGVFSMDKSAEAENTGDPADYPRNTLFDNHFHDCDEFWIIFKGRALVYSEGKPYTISAGSCIATKRGDHHDIAEIYETLQGVYFETTLKSPKRPGHLHNPDGL